MRVALSVSMKPRSSWELLNAMFAVGRTRAQNVIELQTLRRLENLDCVHCTAEQYWRATEEGRQFFNRAEPPFEQQRGVRGSADEAR